MNKKYIGLIGIIFGSLFLSLELYMLKIVQFIDKSSGSWYENAWEYAGRFPCNIALLITIGVIIFSIILFMIKEE